MTSGKIYDQQVVEIVDSFILQLSKEMKSESFHLCRSTMVVSTNTTARSRTLVQRFQRSLVCSRSPILFRKR